MSPRTKKQNENIRQEKRELIIDIALEVFATHGYHGASISTIASHAGIAKGLIYNYFKSKEDLLKAILQKGVQNILAVFQHKIGEVITEEVFCQLLDIYFKQLKENASFWRLYFSIAMQPIVMDLIEKEFEGMVNPYQDLLYSYYSTKGSKDPRADTLLAHALIDGITLNYVMVHNDIDLELFKEVVAKRLTRPLF
jgi:AcrR family transcriptional regulator